MTRLLFALGISMALNAAAQAPAPAPLQVLVNANPKVNWDSKTRVMADVNCDGMADTTFIGYEKGAVWLGVVFGAGPVPNQKPVAMRFDVGKDNQGSFCSTPVKLSTYPIACKTEDGPLPGCRQVKGCSALSMADESCDAFHFYWDGTKKSLTWWRR